VRAVCRECGVKEGELHVPGCFQERCPFCGGQLVSCGCAYEKLGIDGDLTEAQGEAWDQLVKDKGLIPFIVYPNLCAKCGKLWPEMFMVPDAEWERYVEPGMRHEMLCIACYTQIKAWIDGGRDV
jgi:hypothetical protein